MTGEGPEGDEVTLPPREPRPWMVHWLVDSAVTFLVVVIPIAFFGGPVWFSIVLGFVLGVPLTRWTQRAELRGLAARATDRPPPPPATTDDSR